MITIEEALTDSYDRFELEHSPGIAFRVIRRHTVPTEDTVWDGIEEETGDVVVVAVGDNYDRIVDPADLTLLNEDAYLRVLWSGWLQSRRPCLKEDR